jgi:hypothetical protein
MIIFYISVFNVLPLWLKERLALWPIVAFAVSFLISGMIMVFTGTIIFTGFGSFIASLVLALYIVWFRRKYRVRYVMVQKRFLWKRYEGREVASDLRVQ